MSEDRLWCSVLTHAVTDAIKSGDWYYFSHPDFPFICALAGLEPDLIINGICGGKMLSYEEACLKKRVPKGKRKLRKDKKPVNNSCKKVKALILSGT